MCGVQRSATGDHINQLEVGEGEQHREGHDHGNDGGEQRQRDVTKALPAAGAIDGRGLVQRGRNGLQSRQQGDGDKGDATPHVGGNDRPARIPRVTQKIDVVIDPAQLHQHPADDGKLRVIQPPESQRRQGGGHDVGQQDDGSKQGFGGDALVEQNGQPQAQKKLQHAGHKGVEQCVEEGQTRDVVAPKEDVVFQSHPFASPPHLGVGKAQPDTQAQGIGEKEQQQDGRGQHEQQAQGVATVLNRLEHEGWRPREAAGRANRAGQDTPSSHPGAR
ncbi:MAG: hypothetical protein RL655_272 [Pseudomonadota bacterium]